MLLIQNLDPQVTAMVESNFPENQYGFRMCSPELGESYKLLVHPGETKTIVIQNEIPYANICGMYRIKILKSQKILVDECLATGQQVERSPGIYQLAMWHDDGLIWIYKNDTEDQILTE